MREPNWISAVSDGEASRQDWSRINFSQLAEVRDDVADITRRVVASADDAPNAEAEALHRAVARLVLDRFRDPFGKSAENVGWSP
ncbi:MAG: hypothetical protein J2P37_36465, partial [Ktedonobacteraceae bacterium]|nr:hypothetical protein [Ktedonobacteraceae bacterium]